MMTEIAKKLKEKIEINIPDNPGFGQKFSDHIFSMDYNVDEGWHNPEIKPLDNLTIHPATMFMHYGQAVFEGLKAFKTIDGDPVIFRPEKHLKRLNNSARRVCIPEMDESFMLKALIELISVEKNWIPTKPEQSLYIRPLVIGIDPFLGVRPSLTYKCIILLSPVGAYYPEGLKPVNIWVEDKYVRAVRKGLGECKTPANYAASMLAGEEARKNGYTQVLWLDAVEQKYIEEVGTMNIFIRLKDEVVTPKLTGGILPGVTRDSVIKILKKWDINITERLISMAEFVDEYNKGNVLGVFGTGTAAVISSVGWLTYKNNKMVINDGKPDDLALKLYDEITSIQYGKKEDGFNWLTFIEKKGIEA
jgi:branched-chain amino acid aminotransferase